MSTIRKISLEYRILRAQRMAQEKEIRDARAQQAFEQMLKMGVTILAPIRAWRFGGPRSVANIRPSRSKWPPHQGLRESARRLRQQAPWLYA